MADRHQIERRFGCALTTTFGARRALKGLLLATSVLTLASAEKAYAQDAQPAADEATLGEIVVTARRRSESLQDVPQVVNAITSDTLQKLAIKDFRDIQTIVPGLSFGQGGATSIRGVSFNPLTSAQPTTAFYLNEVPVQAGHLFQVLFDVGQIEVLRGPQGTSRGIPAPSGAITVTTRKPDLSEFGGYADGTVTDLQRRSLNGAINIPILRDQLGLRIAGLIDENDGDGIRSIYSKLRPRQVSSAIRTSLSYEPTDAFNATVAYAHFDRASESFTPVTGPGFAGDRFVPATPPIGPKDRVGVQDVPDQTRIHFDVVTAQVDSRLFGQHVEYIGGYSLQHIQSKSDRDTGQNLPGVPVDAFVTTTLEYTSHELRISSDPAPERLFDYVAGVYYGWQEMVDEAHNIEPTFYFPPAFGSPASPSLAAFDPRFNVPRFIPTHSTLQDTSIFGSLTLHLGENTELTGGLRHLWTQTVSDLKVFLGDAPFFFPLPCNLIGLPPGPQPGSCTPMVVAQPPQRRFHEEHTIYNVSLKHSFSRDLMVYGNIGTSYRQPYVSIGVFNASNDPVLSGLQVHPSEKSRSYEVGVKWTFLEGRGRLNAAVYRQKFKDLPTFVPNVPYVAFTTPTTPAVQNFSFTADPDAKVDGFDIDAAWQITPAWNVSAQLSYADGRATTEVPCNDANFDGVPDNGQVTSVSQFPPGVLVALCQGGSVSLAPYWNASLQTEYVHNVRDNVDAYVRGLLTYYPENARQTPAMVIDNYSLLNLYAGLRATDGAWEVGLFVRNALKTDKLTDLSVNQLNNTNGTLSFYPTLRHNSGYFSKTLTPRREVGLTARYAFGSR